MATKKKSKEVIDATGSDVVKIVKGNHLTVTTFPNGRTELVWDDEALLNEVKAAILSVNKQETENGNKTGKQSKRQTSKSK
jgi:hypothetical protein